MSDPVRFEGWFPELGYKVVGQPAMSERIAPRLDPEHARIISYLGKGWVVLSEMGEPRRDVLGADHGVIGPHRVLTDGEWVWPTELLYYVREHRVRLDQRFIEHMRDEGWVPPPVSDTRMAEIIEVVAGPAMRPPLQDASETRS